jgi:hypothetical protein
MFSGKIMTVLPTLTCSLCGKSVAPESCKLDEDGAPVHKHCYLRRNGLAQDSVATKIQPPAAGSGLPK